MTLVESHKHQRLIIEKLMLEIDVLVDYIENGGDYHNDCDFMENIEDVVKTVDALGKKGYKQFAKYKDQTKEDKEYVKMLNNLKL